MTYWPEEKNFNALNEYRVTQFKKINAEYDLMWIKYEELKTMRAPLVLP